MTCQGVLEAYAGNNDTDESGEENSEAVRSKRGEECLVSGAR